MGSRRPISFEAYARVVLERKLLLAPKTRVAAKHHIDRLISRFRGISLDSVTEGQWARYVEKERKKSPRRRFYDDRKYLNSILIAAHEEGLIKRRPRLSNPDPPRDTIGREVTADELARIFQHANPELTLQIEIAYKMGLRLREMLHLRWERIDWNARVIRLKPIDTKSRRGRTVPINGDVFDRLRAKFRRSHSAFAFPHRFDLQRPQNDNKTAWRATLRRAGVRARWHDLRHTCATLMLRRGASVAVVKEYLGMTESVLTGIYQHLNVEDLWKAEALMRTGSGR